VTAFEEQPSLLLLVCLLTQRLKLRRPLPEQPLRHGKCPTEAAHKGDLHPVEVLERDAGASGNARVLAGHCRPLVPILGVDTERRLPRAGAHQGAAHASGRKPHAAAKTQESS
ncbi:MAG: hypothetical protein ACK55Z_01680, partial [bacterium]